MSYRYLIEKQKDIFNVLLIFFFIYSISFTFLPTATTKIIVVLMIIYALFHLRMYLRHISFLQFTIPILSLLIPYTIITFLNGIKDDTFIRLLLFITLQSCLGSYLITIYLQREHTYIFKLIAYATLLQSLFIILSFIVVPFREFLASVLPPLDDVHLNDLYYFRINGLSDPSGAGATLSVVQAFGVLIFMYLSRITQRKQMMYFIFSIIIIVANTVVGRTGMYFGIIFISIYGILYVFSSSIANLIKIGIAMLFIPILLYFFIPEDIKNIFEELVIPWMLDKDHSGQSGKTIDVLKEMWLLPQGIFFWIGEGGWFKEGQHENYIPSDVGYVRLLFAIGLLGVVIFYSTYLKLFYTLKILYPNKNDLLFLFLIFTFCVILETKEPFFLKDSVTRVLFLIYFSYRINFIRQKCNYKIYK